MISLMGGLSRYVDTNFKFLPSFMLHYLDWARSPETIPLKQMFWSRDGEFHDVTDRLVETFNTRNHFSRMHTIQLETIRASWPPPDVTPG